MCFNCLSTTHKIKECKSDKSCRHDGCGRRHHTFLHLPSVKAVNKDKPTPSHATVNSNSTNSEYTFLQIVPVTLFNGKTSVITNAILDSGSDSTLIRSDVATKLGLTGENKPLKISNILSTTASVNSTMVNFEIASNKTDQKTYIENAWVVADLNIPVHKRNIKATKM